MTPAVGGRLGGPVLWLVLAASWLLGVAHLALLPPYEGFDEIAHHASIQQIAATATLPQLGRDRIAREIETYLAAGPSAYPQRRDHIAGRAHDFRSFFDDPAAQAEARRVLSAAPAAPFAPGVIINWQAQHPPLYYAALAPLERALASRSLGDRLFVLRLASWTLAALGLGIAAVALRHWGVRAALPEAAGAALPTAAWPLVMPMALSEFARLGNDSLCLLLFAIAFALMLRIAAFGTSHRLSLGLGLTLGLGLLTKAWFIPIGVGAVGFLVLRGGRHLVAAVFVALVAAAIGGWWYIANLASDGNWAGSAEIGILNAQGGLLDNLTARFSPLAWARGLAAIAGSFVWAGTQTLARLPEPLLAVPTALVGLLLAAYVWTLPRWRAATVWLPAFLIAPMAATLAYHSLVRIALTGTGIGTGGWYLHVLAPAFALAAAQGAAALWSRASGRALIRGLATGATLYFLAAFTMQMLLFAGCAEKDADKHYRLVEAAACLSDPVRLYLRLDVIAWPTVGFTALALSLMLGVGAACRLARTQRA